MLKLGEGTGIDYIYPTTNPEAQEWSNSYPVASIIAKNIIILVNYFLKSVTFGGGGGGGGGGGACTKHAAAEYTHVL